MIIFNKETHYDKLMSRGFEKYINKRDLIILATHWVEIDNVPQNDIIERLIKFCTKWNSEFNAVKYENLLLSVVKLLNVSHETFSTNKQITFFRQEIDNISKIEDKNLQKVLFIIMCIAKWKNNTYIYLNNGNAMKLSDIFKLAGVKATGKQQELFLFKLNGYGFIKVNLKPLLKYDILCLKNIGEAVKAFDVSENMIEYFDELTIKNPITCQRCGKIIEKKVNNQKYCNKCSKEVRLEKDRIRKSKTN